jgi:hypothetical protein
VCRPTHGGATGSHGAGRTACPLARREKSFVPCKLVRANFELEKPWRCRFL